MSGERKIFTGMPTLCVNDLKSGALFYMFSSALVFVWAVVDMVAIRKDYWEGETVVPFTEDHVTYALLMYMGIIYFIASLVVYRAASDPPPPALLPDIPHTCTDELLISWLYFFGTLATVPISAIYAWYYNGGAYGGALAIAILVNTFFLLCVFGHYPNEKTGTPYFAPKAMECCGSTSTTAQLFSKDVMIALWMIYAVGIISIIVCFSMIMYNVRPNDYNAEQVWDYTTAGFTIIFLLFGTTYFLAGLSRFIGQADQEGLMMNNRAESLEAPTSKADVPANEALDVVVEGQA